MGTWPDYDEAVRGTIELYRRVVEPAPTAAPRLTSGEASPEILELAIENERRKSLFRGEARQFDEVSSSLFRELNLPVDGDNFKALVGHDQETIRHIVNTRDATNIAKLSKAQHYSGEEGRPTNLIDFTESLPIALYFACKDYPTDDGRMIVVENSALARTNDLDFSSHQTQRVRPLFFDDMRNTHQWSHFLYPANGVLEAGSYRIFRIPAGCKQAILEHLSANCGIRMDTVSTSSQSWFEAQKFNRLNRNTYMLGLTMEWLGETGQAKRIYSSLAHSAVPDSTIRLLELRGETGWPFTEQDAWTLRDALISKAHNIYNLAEIGHHDSSAVEDLEGLWFKAFVATQLSAHPHPISPPIGPPLWQILRRLGEHMMDKACNGDQILLGQAIGFLKLAIRQYGVEDPRSRNPMMGDLLYSLSYAELRAGLATDAARRIEHAIAQYPDHPKAEAFKELLTSARTLDGG